MMIKILEIIGFALIGGTVYAFLAIIPKGDPSGWPIFLSCASGALAIIMYRNKKKKEMQKE